MTTNKKYKPQLIARESAVKILYQMKIKDDSLEDVMFSFIEKRPYDQKLLNDILSNYVANTETIIELLKSKFNVSYENMPILDLCIMHLGVCEFMFINNSKNIVINEYLNIAKKYSSPKMYTFLNKALDTAL
jgi:transcription antitermination factor NusB